MARSRFLRLPVAPLALRHESVLATLNSMIRSGGIKPSFDSNSAIAFQSSLISGDAPLRPSTVNLAKSLPI